MPELSVGYLGFFPSIKTDLQNNSIEIIMIECTFVKCKQHVLCKSIAKRFRTIPRKCAKSIEKGFGIDWK